VVYLKVPYRHPIRRVEENHEEPANISTPETFSLEYKPDKLALGLNSVCPVL
jgi:hypothetical protein